MSRIDVVQNGNDIGYKILVNFVQRGVVLHDPAFANQEATKLQQEYPSYDLNLFNIHTNAKKRKKKA